MNTHKKGKSRMLLSFVLAAAVTVGVVPTIVSAQEIGQNKSETGIITEIYGSANGWNNNAAWVGFSLDKSLDLKDADADVKVRYEYVEDGEIKSVTKISNAAVYQKNKYWGGYLQDETQQKYSALDQNTVLPADTIIQTNLSSSAKSDLDVTEKIQNGTVTQVRTVVEVIDEEGVSSVAKSNWVTYTKDLNDSAPKGISKDVVVAYEETHSNTRFDAVAAIGDRQFVTLDDAMRAVSDDNTTVTLLQNVYLKSKLNITKGIILDLNGKKITASSEFVYNSGNPNSCHLVDVLSDNVTIKNGTLEATAGNKHTLNVYGAKNVTLENMVIDHTNGVTGAPLIVAGSEVELKGSVKMITGANSWYGMNVDSREINGVATGSAVKFTEDTKVTFEGEKELGIYVENTEAAKVSVSFEEGVTIESSIEGFVALSKVDAAGNIADAEIKNPENAGLDMTEDGTSTPHVHKIEIKGAKEASCTEEGYTGDKVCSVCGEVVEKGQVISKKAHEYKEGKCVVCGAEDPNYKGEGSVEEKDPAETGDNSNGVLGGILLLMTVSGAWMIGSKVSDKRRRNSFDR